MGQEANQMVEGKAEPMDLNYLELITGKLIGNGIKEEDYASSTGRNQLVRDHKLWSCQTKVLKEREDVKLLYTSDAFRGKVGKDYDIEFSETDPLCAICTGPIKYSIALTQAVSSLPFIELVIEGGRITEVNREVDKEEDPYLDRFKDVTIDSNPVDVIDRIIGE